MTLRTMAGLALMLAWCCGCGISGGDGGPGGGTKVGLEFGNLSLAAVTDSSATLRWTTTKDAVCNMSYGRNTASLTGAASSPLGTAHEVTLRDLDADTEYWYTLAASSPLGQRIASQPASFRTLVSPDLSDLTPPVITGLQATGVSTTSATIVWRTDDRARGQVFYGISSAYGSVASEDASRFVRTHAQTLAGLTQNTVYHVRVSALNRANLSAYSGDLTFQTASNPTVAILPDTSYVAAGNEFDLRVHVSNVQNLAGISFAIQYDPGMLDIVSVVETPWYIATKGSAGLGPLREREDSLHGLVQYACTWEIAFDGSVATGTAADGEGDVVVLRCRAVADVDQAYVALLKVDNDHDDIPDNGPDLAGTRLLDVNRQLLPFNVRRGLVIRQGR